MSLPIALLGVPSSLFITVTPSFLHRNLSANNLTSIALGTMRTLNVLFGLSFRCSYSFII
eukprot:m.623260 g.623260  ORF g.623260 m.623260 type:complete len:60 (-) comp58222_c0_seq63:1230-1409(-)